MKTYFKALATKAAGLGFTLVAVVAFANAAQAQTQQPQPVQVTQADAASLRIRINNPNLKAAQLRVVHLENDNVILNQTHRTAAYGTLLKFGGLPTGRYAVVLRVGPNRYRYTVQVTTPAAGTTAIAVQETTTRRVENGLASAVTAAGL